MTAMLKVVKNQKQMPSKAPKILRKMQKLVRTRIRTRKMARMRKKMKTTMTKTKMTKTKMTKTKMTKNPSQIQMMILSMSRSMHP